MPNEALKLKARTMFLMDHSFEDISEALDINHRTVANWSKTHNWGADRKDFLKKAKDVVDNRLLEIASEIAQLNVEFAHSIAGKLKEKFVYEIDDAPAGNLKDLMAGIRDGVEVIDKLLRMGLPDESQEDKSDVLELSFEQKRELLTAINTVKISIPEDSNVGDEA